MHGVLAKICSEVAAKSAWFRERLGSEVFQDFWTKEDYSAVLAPHLLHARGKTRRTLEGYDFDSIRDRIGELIHGSGQPLRVRFQAFVDQLRRSAPEPARRLRQRALALHLPRPALAVDALDVGSAHAHGLAAAGDHGRLRLARARSDGEVYMKVGRALAFVHENGDAAGFQAHQQDHLRHRRLPELRLCHLRVHRAQDAHDAGIQQGDAPGLPEFCRRRLLGVHQKGSRPEAA